MPEDSDHGWSVARNPLKPLNHLESLREKERSAAELGLLSLLMPPALFDANYALLPQHQAGQLATSDVIRCLAKQPGQVLRAPWRGGVETAAPAPAPAAGEQVTYVVRGGATLFQIAQSYKTTVEKIKADNGLASDILFVGQKLVITAGKTG